MKETGLIPIRKLKKAKDCRKYIFFEYIRNIYHGQIPLINVKYTPPFNRAEYYNSGTLEGLNTLTKEHIELEIYEDSPNVAKMEKFMDKYQGNLEGIWVKCHEFMRFTKKDIVLNTHTATVLDKKPVCPAKQKRRHN